jgi:hypothetical protein
MCRIYLQIIGLESGIYQLTKSINEQRVTIASLVIYDIKFECDF